MNSGLKRDIVLSLGADLADQGYLQTDEVEATHPLYAETIGLSAADRAHLDQFLSGVYYGRTMDASRADCLAAELFAATEEIATIRTQLKRRTALFAAALFMLCGIVLGICHTTNQGLANDLAMAQASDPGGTR
ncbi:MAG: hypothetical protein ACO1SV_27520 [Fimbriimonas sp.]